MVMFGKGEAALALEMLQNAKKIHGIRLMDYAAECRQKKRKVVVSTKHRNYITESGVLTWQQGWLVAYCLLHPEQVFKEEIEARLRQISQGTADTNTPILVGN